MKNQVSRIMPPVILFGVSAAAAFLLVTGIPAIGDALTIPVAAMNCTATCERVYITERPVDCNYWHPNMPRDELHCSWTSRGIGNVSLITDPANYITAPFTKEQYIETRITLFDTSWDLEFLPDDSLLVTENPPEPRFQERSSGTLTVSGGS